MSQEYNLQMLADFRKIYNNRTQSSDQPTAEQQPNQAD